MLMDDSAAHFHVDLGNFSSLCQSRSFSLSAGLFCLRTTMHAVKFIREGPIGFGTRYIWDAIQYFL